MTPELIIAIEACMKAGRAIAKHDCRVPVLADGTEEAFAPDDAVLESHQLITRALSVTGLPILSEYGEPVPYEIRSGWLQFWMVSPLEGVDELIDRSGEYTVSVALIEGHEPVLGVVYVPAKDELYCASRETGAFHVLEASSSIAFTTKLFRPARNGLLSGTRSCRILVSRSRNDEMVLKYMNDLGNNDLSMDIVSNGGALNFCLVAAREADLYPRFDATLEWETAAGHAILKAVGKNVLDIRTGQELVYNKPDMVNPCFIAQ